MARVSVFLLPALLVGCLDWPEELMRPDGTATNESGSCPAVCVNHCSQGLCVLDCSKTACACPAGYPCEVRCNSRGECPYAIDCSQATRCDVHCEQDDTCAGKITCGSGFCSVECLRTGSCAGGVDCQASCGCSVQGTGASSVLCPPSCKNGCRTVNSCDGC